MKKLMLLLFFLLFINNIQAQVQVFPPPSESEKAELKKLMSQYEAFVNFMSGEASADMKKTQSIKFMKECLAKGTTYTFNDVDSTNTDKINFLVYMNKLSDAYGGKTQHLINSSLSYTPVKYDQWRRFYYTEIKVNKTVQWKEIVSYKQVIEDSINQTSDSLMSSDTLLKKHSFNLSFFIRFEKENTLSKNFRIFGITRGELPELPPLDPLQQWWSELDSGWKTAFQKIRKIEEYPSTFELEKLTYLSELDFTNAVMNSYEPLSKFTNVKKLTLTGASIDSFEPLSKMTGLRYLDISKTKIESIQGIEQLTKLEEFTGVGNKIKSIEPLRNNIALIKLNCSENDLDDISPVKDLINLKELNVSLNIRLKNIDAVKGLVNMEKISFRKIEIKDLSPVQNMNYLVYLDAYNTGVTSLEPIRNMQKIFHLDLSGNKITSLDPIRNYKYLLNLYLNTSSISDLSVIDNFALLRELDIANCPQIKTLGGIHKLDFLTSLKCYFTGIDKNEIARFKKNHPKCGVTYY